MLTGSSKRRVPGKCCDFVSAPTANRWIEPTTGCRWATNPPRQSAPPQQPCATATQSVHVQHSTWPFDSLPLQRRPTHPASNQPSTALDSTPFLWHCVDAPTLSLPIGGVGQEPARPSRFSPAIRVQQIGAVEPHTQDHHIEYWMIEVDMNGSGKSQFETFRRVPRQVITRTPRAVQLDRIGGLIHLPRQSRILA